MSENLPKNFNLNEAPYQENGLRREYQRAYDSFQEKIQQLEPDVQVVINSIFSPQQKLDAYMAHPIDALQEFVDDFKFAPGTIVEAAALRKVLKTKLENIQG